MDESYKLFVSRSKVFKQKVVIVDGFPGCGKTMLSPILAGLDRVELMIYAGEFEYFCALDSLKQIQRSAASAMIRLYTDFHFYQNMQSREINFRFSDISSVFKDANPWRYFYRLFRKGSEAIPGYIEKGKPILHLATHRLLRISEPVFAALRERLVMVEVVRHPLFMIKQDYLNMKRLVFSASDLSMYYTKNGIEYPEWAYGWEDQFRQSNDVEKIIYSYKILSEKTKKARGTLPEKYSAKMITIPFEKFVIDPWAYMNEITEALETKITRLTRRAMKKQKVPRKLLADAPQLNAYKRCGWNPPIKESTEEKEFQVRWNFVAEKASKKALKTFVQCCEDYENDFLGGIKDYQKRGL